MSRRPRSASASGGVGGVPVTWPELLAADRPRLAELLPRALDNAKRAKDLRPPALVSQLFTGPAVTLSEAMIVLDPKVCARFLTALIPLLARAVPELDPLVEDRFASAMYTLSFVNVARCCGATLPPRANGLEEAWLPRVAASKPPLSELERQTFAFIALALRLPDLAAHFIGGGRLPVSFTPGKVFGFDTQRFVRYLALAQQRGASFQDIDPAWLDFVHRFPYKLGAQTLTWPDLLWCARALMVQFEGRPVGEVGVQLHRLVTAGGAA